MTVFAIVEQNRKWIFIPQQNYGSEIWKSKKIIILDSKRVNIHQNGYSRVKRRKGVDQF